jgi:hypothetical protein
VIEGEVQLMDATTKELVIKTEVGAVVARINMKGAVLEGHCEWRDGSGDLVAYGFFKDGSPFTGTFLNWSKFFPEPNKAHPYEATTYAQDWVTKFEMVFRSERPKYDMLLEAYYRGRAYTPTTTG